MALTTPISDLLIAELARHDDARGWLAEFFRMDEFSFQPTMGYCSVTLPGVARGPHEHRLQTDLFVAAGPGEFQFYFYDNRPQSPTHGKSYSEKFGASRPASLVVPPGIIHAYRCVSSEPGMIINLPDRLYKGPGRKHEVDEIRHEDNPDCPFYSVFDRALFDGKG